MILFPFAFVVANIAVTSSICHRINMVLHCISTVATCTFYFSGGEKLSLPIITMSSLFVLAFFYSRDYYCDVGWKHFIFSFPW